MPSTIFCGIRRFGKVTIAPKLEFQIYLKTLISEVEHAGGHNFPLCVHFMQITQRAHTRGKRCIVLEQM